MSKIRKRNIEKIITLETGTSQPRIKESDSFDSKEYIFYNQSSLTNDLTGFDVEEEELKKITTKDRVAVFEAGDIVFSLISGKAAIVSQKREGYIQTRNYLKMKPTGEIDSKYLVFLLNEDPWIQKQYLMGLQGTMVIKFNLSQIKDLEIKYITNKEKQIKIGDTYLKQLKLEALRKKAVELKTKETLAWLREVNKNE